MNRSTADEVFHLHGYRLTPQRHLILQVLEQANEHLTVEQIYQQVHARYPHVTLSTIYRTLELCQALGIVHTTRVPGQPTRYEPETGSAHHHLVCQRCQVTFHLDEHLLEHVPEHVQTQHHFHMLRLDLLVMGYCDACWEVTKQEQEARHCKSVSSITLDAALVENQKIPQDVQRVDTRYTGGAIQE